MSEEENLTERVTVLMAPTLKDEIEAIVNANKDRYASTGHFLRAAAFRLVREHKEVKDNEQQTRTPRHTGAHF